MEIIEIEELTKFLLGKHPNATLLLTGSFAQGTQTEFSDFDILSIQETGFEPYRKAYQFRDRLVEVFCHTENSMIHWMADNTKIRKKSMASMIFHSRLMIGDIQVLSRLREHSHRVIEAGPPSFTPEEDWKERKTITEKLDDLLGLKSRNERVILGTDLFIVVLNYYLVQSGRWLTNGKYYRQALSELGHDEIDNFSRAINDLVNSGDSKPLAKATEDILKRFGGKAYEYQESANTGFFPTGVDPDPSRSTRSSTPWGSTKTP